MAACTVTLYRLVLNNTLSITHHLRRSLGDSGMQLGGRALANTGPGFDSQDHKGGLSAQYSIQEDDVHF